MQNQDYDFSKPIRIKSGLIQGQPVDDRDDVYVYKGVPYAAPPVGELRWKPPRGVQNWEGIRECIEYGPSCPQPKLPAPFGRDYGPYSEDCLYLNVWTGARSSEERRPVMVWIHGGGLYAGSSSTPDFDGRVLAQEGAVVVTVNYRLGVFGFLAHPELSRESEHKVSGNYGLLDQIAALQWVRENIAAFGGDPDRVTIFGESGGGRSVCFLMTSPLSQGLFHRAIAQSGSLYRGCGHLTRPHDEFPPLETLGERVARLRGCGSLEELRQKTADEIMRTFKPTTVPLLAAPGSLSIPEGIFVTCPAIDGWVFPEDPVKILEEGKQHKVPLISGSNQDEASMFLPAFKVGHDSLLSVAAHFFPGHEQEIIKLYQEFGPPEFLQALNRFGTDAVWTRPARATAMAMEKVPVKAYVYQFTHSRGGVLQRFGAFHGVEIRFVFGHDIGANLPWTKEEHRISKNMRTYWLRFAAAGDPNGPDLPEWPAFDRVTEKSLEIGREIKVRPNLRKEACDLFDRIDLERRGN